MRRVIREEKKARQEISYKSEQYKDGIFTKEELKLYGLEDEEIAVILDYQALLPVLQTDDDSLLDARSLYKELKVSRDFSNWIKQQIEENDLIKNVDYYIQDKKDSSLKAKTLKTNTSEELSVGGRPSIEYKLTLDAAKSIAMVAGAKAGNTNKELKEMSKLVRRYFIIVEKAFKNRIKWNINRKNTLINCKELRRALMTHRQELRDNIPQWMNPYANLYEVEFGLLNNIILGMSATEYKKTHRLSNKNLIRNYFTEDQLDDVERLERYDAQLITVQEIYSYDERKQILRKEYELHKNRRTKYV